MLQIGSHQFDHLLALAPMAGVTDLPFRQLCRQLGANWLPSEMISSHPKLRLTEKTRLRSHHDSEPSPITVQIAGAIPTIMADAARYHVDQGAEIIDINMGCPAKKVCGVAAGAALLSNETRVAEILTVVVKAIDVPVTLKTRTGPCQHSQNIKQIAHIAEQCGIQMLTIHGRTREQKFQGEAEYDTIAQVKSRINIPIIANGDINTPEKARWVLQKTGADGLMIGRAAQGNPWIFREIQHYLKHGQQAPRPKISEIKFTLLKHLSHLYAFYGEAKGLRVARKHIAWYLNSQPQFTKIKATLFSIDRAEQQYTLLSNFFEQQLPIETLAA